MSDKYDEYFTKASKKYDVDKNLLKAVAKTESDFNPNAVSSAGAVGIMQLMPTTAKELGVKNSYDPEQNIMGGAKYLSQLLTEFDGNTELALSAYNAGASRVKESGEVLSYTEGYVNKVMSNYGSSGGSVGYVSTGSSSNDLKWWGDILRIILVLLLIVLSVVLFSIGVGSNSGDIKKQIIKKAVKKTGGES